MNGDRLLERDEHYRFHNDSRIDRIEAQHPREVVEERLRNPLSRRDSWELYPLLRALDDATLDLIAARGENAQELIAEFRDYRDSPADPPSTPPRPPTLKELIDAGNEEAVLARNPDRKDVGSLDPSRKEVVARWVRRRWRAVAGDGGSPLDMIQRDAAGGSWSAPEKVWVLLAWAAAANMALRSAEWLRLAELGLSSPKAWLQRCFRPAWWRAVRTAAEGLEIVELEGLVEALPEPWPPSAARLLAERCFARQTSIETRRRCVRELVLRGQRRALEALQSRYDDPLLVEGLARLNVSWAEKKMLQCFAEEGYPLQDLRFQGGDGHWVEHLGCPSSMPLLLDAVRALLRRGEEAHDCRPLFRAMERTGKEQALTAYDSLIADAEIPHAAFLWYEREEVVGRLFEAELSSRLPGDLAALAALIQPPIDEQRSVS